MIIIIPPTYSGIKLASIKEKYTAVKAIQVVKTCREIASNGLSNGFLRRSRLNFIFDTHILRAEY